MNPDVVLDIGANTGEFIINAKKTFPSARIIAFEPVQSCFIKLKERFGNKSNIKLYNVALGSENKKGEIFVSDFSPSSSIVRPAGNYKTEEIDIKKLDEYLDLLKEEDKVFIKIDVEGFELEVLKGAESVLRQADWIYLESRILDSIGCDFTDLYNYLTSRHWSFLGSYDNVFNDKGYLIYFDALFLNMHRNSLPKP
jgi:FkbM family methyltransferase